MAMVNEDLKNSFVRSLLVFFFSGVESPEWKPNPLLPPPRLSLSVLCLLSPPRTVVPHQFDIRTSYRLLPRSRVLASRLLLSRPHRALL
ncbi:hypothetical protein Taro_016159 [Colocasia esculenta]|uniref:Uncharacterized protein n=1 Tax=Colocasia esculenta TaxID=4460 RepID=A0A843US63_COLES|nr:hypothetical protein [Colocasia esculenta]